jgi:hypothetical protein
MVGLGMNKRASKDQYSEKEAADRRDALLKHMMSKFEDRKVTLDRVGMHLAAHVLFGDVVRPRSCLLTSLWPVGAGSLILSALTREAATLDVEST